MEETKKASIIETIGKDFGAAPFTTKEACDRVSEENGVNRESVRARIYEAIDRGILKRISKGLYKSRDCLLIEGDGRDLSFLANETIDAIVTDHPYDIGASNKGGNRSFADYECFRYEQKDFDEKARVLKKGSFLVEFIPEENADNYEYLYQLKEMAKKAGFVYYSKVAWQKKGFVSNCGRKSKDSEDVLIFTKGKARCLRPDAKKNLADPSIQHYMSGANGMLPTTFSYSKPENMIHQAEKPVELLESILDYVTLPNEIVIDQFAGSGVLGEAALKKGRKSILIEISHECVEKIVSRLGMKPCLTNYAV